MLCASDFPCFMVADPRDTSRVRQGLHKQEAEPRILQLIQDEKCTHMNLVPTIYGWMVDNPDVEKYDLSSLRLLSYAGSPFPTEVLKKCIKKFGNKFCQGYGATETAGAQSECWPRRITILKGPNPNTWSAQVSLSLFTGERSWMKQYRPGRPGERGEICAKGKHIMMGYWKNPTDGQGPHRRMVPHRRHRLHG